MMGYRLPVRRSGDEFDCITGWRHQLKFFERTGVASRIKRGMRRRERRQASAVIDRGLDECAPDASCCLEGWEEEDFLDDYPWDVLDPPEAITEPLRVSLREHVSTP